MSDDKLLEGIARAAREAAASDPLSTDWDAVSAGTLSAAEVLALRESCTDPELARRAAQAFKPLDDDFRARLVTTAVNAGQTSTAAPRANVVPLVRRAVSAPWALGLAASAIVAVGVAFFLTTSSPPGGVSLPGYGYELRGTAQTRSGSGQSVRADESFELILTPQTALATPAQVRLFRDTGTELVPVATHSAQIAISGAARVVAPASTLPLGEVTLVAVISYGEWPDRASLAQPATGNWRALRIPLHVVAPPQ